MLEDGRAYGLIIALKHLLRTLERKGVLAHSETVTMLDAALDELKSIPNLKGDAAADAARAVGSLYLK
jgi:hypothetical protein